MKWRTVIAGIALIPAIGAWWAFRPERLFMDRIVNEPLAVDGPDSATAMHAAIAMGNDAMAGAAVIATGSFTGVAHETRGTAAVYRLADGTRLLRFTDFETSNGPDVRVYLVAASDVTDHATVRRAGFVELGALKGNKGDQNYVIPSGVDLERFRTVTIWCERFSVNFGSAALSR